MVAVGWANHSIWRTCRCDARCLFSNINLRRIVSGDFAWLGNRCPTQCIQIVSLELATTAGLFLGCIICFDKEIANKPPEEDHHNDGPQEY